MSNLSDKVKVALRGATALIILILVGAFIMSVFQKNKVDTFNLSGSGLAQVADGSDAPQYYYFNKKRDALPTVTADAYIVGDLDTGEIILRKNEDKKFPIASVSKLMTALVGRELATEEDIAVVSKKALATEGGNGNLSLGEKIKVSQLLYPLLLESSNDAAEVIAEHFDREDFIKKMNREAEKLEMTSTFYEDPSGLSIENKSTAEDLFKLTGYLINSRPQIFEITTERSYSDKKHHWSSNNQFLHDEGYLGGKSGYTDPALQTGISLFSLPLAEATDRKIGVVVLHTKDRHKDVESIVNYLKKYIYYGGESDANTAWVKQKEGVPEIPEPDYVLLSFAGDIMLDRGVRNSVLKNFGGDYSALFEKLSILKKSDIVFANLEGPASDQGMDKHNLYSFRMDPAIIPALSGSGFNVLSVANNHVGDWGLPAYADTLSRLRENEILYTGGGMSYEEASQPVVMEKYGIRLGFLGFSDKGPGDMAAKEFEAGVLLASDPNFDNIVKNAAAQVDYLVVSFHFGEEYQPKHDERQEELAHRAVDDGAKIVVGAHPHVVQDFETYRNSFIAYSLGNFIFDQKFLEATMQGALLDVKLYKDGNLTVRKNTVKLNSAFQPDQIIRGIEEKLKFQ
jgi:gamma-polyglutamate biosynthesis protein CapA